jgi:hypothetical protein
VVAKTLAIGDRDGGLMYRLSSRAGAFSLAEHEAIAVDWISLAIRDADPDLAADVMVSGATWLATQYGVDRELLVNLVTGTPRRGRSGVDRHRDPAGPAALVRAARGRAVPGAGVTAGVIQATAIAEAFTPDQVAAFAGALEAVARRPIRAGQLVAASDVYLRDDWAELLVQLAAFGHIRISPGCRGYTTWSSGRAGCGWCHWGMSARMGDAGTAGSARFAQAAIARVGHAVALAVGEVVQALFEAVLPC